MDRAALSPPVAVRLPRCCPDHRDWTTLADHLLDEFATVPASTIIRELWRARKFGELFDLTPTDALDCAELIVRQRVISATGGMPSRGPRKAAATSAP
jgi:hypothetical protein